MILPETGNAGGGQCERLNHEDQLWANDLVNHLDDWIAEEVRESGVAELVDVRNAFQGHGLCSTDPYVNHIRLKLVGVKPESFHRNAEGQAGFFRLVLAQYKRGAGATTRVNVAQVRTTTRIVRVPRGTGAITFSSRWPGSTASMTLVSPHGHRYSSSTKGTRHAAGRTFETYIINRPQAGRWKVRLHGTHVRKAESPLPSQLAAPGRRPQFASRFRADRGSLVES